MYNYYQQQPNVTSSINPRPNLGGMQYSGLKGHPVSSLEEVKASTIEFDGSIFYFPDIANKRIYTKVVGNDGVALLNMYELKPLPPDPIEGDYVTRQEFEQALNRISELLSNASVNVPTTQTKPQEPNYKEVF